MATGRRTPGQQTPTIALVAGEESGDLLGGELATALREVLGDVRLVGIGGARMRAAGVECWHDIDELSVMGIAEILRHLPRLLRLRRRLGNRLLAARPDVVVGIDAPDFNLGLERRMKRAGIATAHYVSPSVWAWREGRAARIGRSADLVLCLFPMEPAIYARHGVRAQFTGHPLATRFPLAADREGARARLGLPADERVLALLPGSRRSEIERLADDFLATAVELCRRFPDLRVVVPAANARCHAALAPRVATLGAAAGSIRLLDGDAHEALAAADVALLASGTAALEAMLAKCPMVVAYRISRLTHAMIRGLRLMRSNRYSLPNVLAGRALVPELMQDECRVDNLVDATANLLADAAAREAMRTAFAELHRGLLGDGAAPATQAVAAIAALLPEQRADG